MTAPLPFPVPLPTSFTSSSSIDHSFPSPASTTTISTTATVFTIPSSRSRHASESRMFEPIPPSNLLKIYKGCSNCRTQKIKCNGQEPCSRCRAFGLQCQYIVLPNQAAHRLAALAAAPSSSAIPAGPSSNLSIPPSAANSPSSSSASTSSAASSRARSTKKKNRSTFPSLRRTDDDDADLSPELSPSRPPSSSPPLPTLPAFSTITLAYAQSLSGPPNILLHTISEAVDQNVYAYRGPPSPDAPAPDPELMRRLIRLYLRYVHPIHRIVDEHDPDFWTRLDRPMEPEVASIVYAMCTVGAMFMIQTPTTGQEDETVYDFYSRAVAIKNSRPEDITTIQTILILQEFFVVTNQIETSTKAYTHMMEIAHKIGLGEQVKKIATQDKLSPADAIIRNTWRVIIWTETMANLISSKSVVKIDPLKDLTSPALDTRPEEVPIARSPPLDAAIYYYGNLFKIYQAMTKIKLPISSRDLHPVTSILDCFGTWQNSLPKNLRCNTARNSSAGGQGSISPLASTLDTYYRLGHIFLLNSLPAIVRSSPTGLGPRRESPLRILATCANGITATMGDLIREADLRNFCMISAMRCLTEAAGIQLANSKEPDPAISTPAKVNFMKTLWCIKHYNFAVPAARLASILAPYDNIGKQATSVQRQERQSGHREGGRQRTPSFSTESSSMAGPPRGRRGVSMASDYSSSTTSTREGSHTTCETDEQDRERERPNQLPFSPSQDSATTSLASFPLGSQQAQLKIVGLRGTATELSTASTIPWDTQFETSEHGPQAPVSHSRSGQRIFKDVYDGDRSRSSSVSLISPNVETHIAGFFHAMDIQPPPLPLHANHHRSGVYFHQGPEDRLPHEAHQFHSITGSGKNEADPLMHIRAPSGSLHPEPALIRGRLDRSGEQYLHDNGRRHNSAEPRRVDWVDQGELTPVETSRSPVEERSIHVGQAGMPLRPISPVRSPGYGASHGSASASLPQPWEDLNVARRPCPHHVRQVSQSSRPVKDSGPAVSPSQQRHSVRSERSKPRAREYFGSSRHQQVDNVYMAVSQSLHVTTTFPNRPYHPHEQNPRTPVSAASDIDESNGYGAAYHHSTHSPSTIMTHDAYGRPRSRSSRNPSDINTVSPGVIAYDQGYLPRPLPVRSGATAVMDLSSQPSTPISRTGQHSPFNQRINVRPAMTDTAEIMSPQEQAGYGHLHPQHPHQQQQQQRPHRQKILPQERVLQPEVLHDEQSRAFETRHGYEFDGLRPELIDLTSPSSTPPLQQRFATPLSPPSPGAIRSIAIVDSRSKMLAPGQDLRGENGGSEGAGGRSIGSYDGRPMTGQWKTGTLSTGPRGPAPATLVGRKRPSESMYGTEDRDEGLGEGSHGGWHGSGIGDAMDISETGESGSAAFDANPLYRDGVEVVEPRKQKQQKLEKHGRQARQMQYPYAAFQAGMHPDETMPQHPRYVEQDQAPPLQQHHHQEFAIQVHQQPSTSRHSQMPSPTSNRLPRPSHPQQQMQAQEQAHYSYQSYQPSSPSYHVLQQKHQQHEPRTSPVSSYPSAAAAATAPPPSSSSSSSSSAASITRPYPRDNYGAPPALQIQQQQAHLQQQIRQDRMFQQQLQQRERQLQQQQQREMMPPPPVLPSGRLGETGSTMNSAGVPSDGEGEDSAALMPDMMRDLVRRQRR